MTKQEKKERKIERQKLNKEINETIKKMMALPFIADVGEGRKKKRTFWNVKPTGDYFLDCETGREYGALFMKYIKESGDSLLTQCVLDMNPKAKNKGIEVGFLYFIENMAKINNIDPLLLADYQKRKTAEAIEALQNG